MDLAVQLVQMISEINYSVTICCALITIKTNWSEAMFHGFFTNNCVMELAVQLVQIISQNNYSISILCDLITIKTNWSEAMFHGFFQSLIIKETNPNWSGFTWSCDQSLASNWLRWQFMSQWNWRHIRGRWIKARLLAVWAIVASAL